MFPVVWDKQGFGLWVVRGGLELNIIRILMILSDWRKPIRGVV